MNQRIMLTKQLIKNTFFELLKEKPVNRITVTQICENAGINRTTFYKYYLDVWDLLDKIEDELAGLMNNYIVDNPSPNSVDVVIGILKAIRLHGDRYLSLASGHGDSNYINNAFNKWYAENDGLVKVMLPGLEDRKRRWAYDFITQGDTAIVMNWLEGGMKENEEEVAAFINTLNKSVINQNGMKNSCGYDKRK